MCKFKVGDRVRVYEFVHKHEGTVSFIGVTGLINIEISPGNTISGVHPKQCRKLVKRKTEYLWVNPDKIGYFINTSPFQQISTIEMPGWIRYKKVN